MPGFGLSFSLKNAFQNLTFSLFAMFSIKKTQKQKEDCRLFACQ